MTNPFYNHDSGIPASNSRAQSGTVRAEFDLIGAGFTAVDERISDAEDVATASTAAIADLDTVVGGHTTSIGTLESDVSTLTSDLSALTVVAITETTGTFTPAIYGSSAAGVGTYISQLGFYSKIGTIVHFEIILQWSAHTGTGNMRVSGLPFSRGNGAPVFAVKLDQVLAPDHVAFAVSDSLDDKIQFYARDVAADGDNENVAMTTSGTAQVSGFYFA
jgi:hypothetical protein